MYHSITFDDKNTWDDWHLIPSSRPSFNMPSYKTKEIEIPGVNGSLDISEILTGRPVYGNRTGSFEFIVVNDYWDWTVAYSTIANYLHGKRRHAILEDDPYYYYSGLFTVDSWKSNRDYSTISINYNVYPFKLKIESTIDDWEWDPFNFETGIIQEFSDIPVSGTETVEIYGSPELTAPSFTVSDQMTVTFKGETYTLYPNKTNKYLRIILEDGPNELTFTGNGTVSIIYRGGWL